MEAHEEAKVLYESVVGALNAFSDTARGVDFKESEAKERYNAIRWMLIIARNEAYAMFQEWNGDFCKVSK
jgi:hypothetical protein